MRQFDEKSHHQFFVDTKANPPRSIWHHPYDDEDYLRTLPSEERERIESLHGLQREPTQADIAAEISDDDHDSHSIGKGSPTDSRPSQRPADLPPRPAASQEKKTFGRKLKDKLTNTTHEQREAERHQRAQEEMRAYEAHQAFRRAMAEAARTGQPQYVGKSRDGKDVYIEAPQGPAGYGYGPGCYRRGGGGPYGGYAGPGQAYNPYAQGPYANPDARFIRPADPYYRPNGYGYGGGLGLPLLGGLAGGLLLGSALF